MQLISRVLIGGAAVLGLVALSGCSDQVSAADAYAVGCRAVDAVAVGGAVAGETSLDGLDALYDSRVLGTEAQAWLGDAISYLKSGDAPSVPATTRQRIAAGCAAHGQPLSHLAA